jgi:hypothetical protein
MFIVPSMGPAMVSKGRNKLAADSSPGLVMSFGRTMLLSHADSGNMLWSLNKFKY